FDDTPEPAGTAARKRAGRKSSAQMARDALSYVIQEHDARRLHYDFRLELNGTLLSWAVPKGPSLDPSVKRLAVHVEDHPIEYGSFEGEIPPGNYGAGTVIVWDRGNWRSNSDDNPLAAYQAGKLKFVLDGEKLHGGWTLVRSHMRGNGDKEQWLLIKERDGDARDEADYAVLLKKPGSGMSDSLGARKKNGELRDIKERKRAAKSAKAVPSPRKPALRNGEKAPAQPRPDIVANRNAESLRTLAQDPAI